MPIKFNEFDIQDLAVRNAIKEIIFDLDKLRLDVGTDDGDSIFYASTYIRSASAPATPTVDDGSYNFTTGVLTPPSSWSTGVPSGTDPVYISQGTFSINGTVGVDSTITWSVPVILAQDGTSSASGDSVFVANTYQRAASAPSTPSVDDGSYNFTSNTLTPPTGWSVAVPSGSDPLYISQGTFTISGATGTDSTVTWTAPVIFAQDGATGTEGSSFFTGNVFIRAASAPSTPSVDDGSFNFTTNVLTPPTGWSASPPAGSDPLYVSTGSFSISGSTGTDNTVTWTSPDLLVSDGADGSNGSAGGDGDSVFVANAYQRAASAPSTPTVNDGSYNFTTNTLTPPTGWSVAPPAGANPLYVTTGTFAISGATGTDNTVTWTSPDILVQDGATGGTGPTGPTGTDSVSTQLTNPAHVTVADNDGTNYSLTNAGGTHQVYEGSTDETTNATHSVVGSATLNGLTISVVAGTGVYSLSGASWTSDQETFTLRAAFNSVNYDKIYTIAKSKAGGTGTTSSVQSSGGTFQDISGSPTNAEAGYRVGLNGKEQSRTGQGSSYSNDADWLLSGSPSDYEIFMEDLGTGNTTPTGSSLDTWVAPTANQQWELIDTSSGGSAMTFNGRIRFRNATTQTEYTSAASNVSLDVEETL